MDINEARNRLRNYNFQFGEHDTLTDYNPLNISDEFRKQTEGTFFLSIHILSPQFKDYRAVREAGFDIVVEGTTTNERLLWIKPKVD